MCSQSHPGRSSADTLIIQPTSGEKPEVGSAIAQCQLLAVRWRNVTPSHWKCPVNGQCRFEWGFCLLSLSQDGPGPAVADLDLCVLIQGECAHCAAQQHDGTGRKSKVRCVKIYFWNNRQTEKTLFSLFLIVILLISL